MDERDTREVRAASFGGVADVYERSRPGYPLDAVRWLVRGDAAGRPRDVLDLGAGTGKLTAALVELGHRVIAVDPSAEMLEQLRRSLPAVIAHVGAAETIPLPAAAVDAVTVAQAFHWFDHGRALPEIARVLRPGGTLAAVWNVRDESVPWVAELSAVIGSEHHRQPYVLSALDGNELFEEAESATFRQAVVYDRVSLLELVRSRSYCAVRAGEERGRVLAEVERVYDAYAANGDLVLPYRVECFRARRA